MDWFFNVFWNANWHVFDDFVGLKKKKVEK